MPKEIKSLLNSFIHPDIAAQNTATNKQYASWQIYLIANWNSIIGKLKDHATLEKIERDTLIISVTNSSWLQELYILSNMLIKKINNKLPAPYVKQLKFRLHEKKDFKVRTTHKAGFPSSYAPDIKLTKKEESALEKIVDQELKLELKKFLIKCKEKI